MNPLLLLALAVTLCAAPSLASACRIGGDEVLFEAPPPDAPPGTEAMSGRFTNHGAHFERWQEFLPAVEEASLIGLFEDERGRSFPVYHPVTSCLHGFYGEPKTEIDRQTFLVGRVERIGSHTVFMAAGNWNGRWINVR